MGRGIDHLVLAARDLDAARDRYRAMGFALTPRATHPWGTANHLAQLQGCYLELLSVADPARIPEHGPRAFSFDAFNRDFLRRREGFSMLALESGDAAADARAFAEAGLGDWAAFAFSRVGRLPDGAEAVFAFVLAFARDPAAPDIGYFACERRAPSFWRPEYRAHANTALTVSEVLIVADEPAAHADFLRVLTGGRVETAPDGIAVETPRGRLAVLTPRAAAEAWGTAPPRAVPAPYLAGYRIAVADLDAARTALDAGGVPFAARAPGIVVEAADAHGVAIAFATGRGAA